MLTLRHALVRQHYGRALKIMMKQSEDKATKDLDGRMVEVSESAITASRHHCHHNHHPVSYTHLTLPTKRIV